MENNIYAPKKIALASNEIVINAAHCEVVVSDSLYVYQHGVRIDVYAEIAFLRGAIEQLLQQNLKLKDEVGTLQDKQAMMEMWHELQ